MSIKITEEGKTLLEDAILQDKKVVFSQIELIADVEKSPTEMVKRVDVSKVSASDYNTITVQAQIDNDGFLDTYYFNRANVYADEVLFAYDDGINICIPAETTKVINDLEMMMKIDSAVADLKIIYEGYVLRKDFNDMESKIQKINTTIKDMEANAVTQNDCTDQVSWNSQIVKKEFLTIGNMAFFRATGGFSTSRGSIVLATIPQGYFPETTRNQSSYELMGVFTSAYDKERRNCYVTLNCLSGNVDLQINNNEAYSDTRSDDNVQMIFYGFWKMNAESQGGTGGSISYREDIEKLRQSIQDSKKEIVRSSREIDSLKEDLDNMEVMSNSIEFNVKNINFINGQVLKDTGKTESVSTFYTTNFIPTPLIDKLIISMDGPAIVRFAQYDASKNFIDGTYINTSDTTQFINVVFSDSTRYMKICVGSWTDLKPIEYYKSIISIAGDMVLGEIKKIPKYKKAQYVKENITYSYLPLKINTGVDVPNGIFEKRNIKASTFFEYYNDMVSISVSPNLLFMVSANSDGYGSEATTVAVWRSEDFELSDFNYRYIFLQVKKQDGSEITLADIANSVQIKRYTSIDDYVGKSEHIISANNIKNAPVVSKLVDESYAHESNFVIINGMCYMHYMYNTWDKWSDMNIHPETQGYIGVRLSVFSIAEPDKRTVYNIVRGGDDFLGETVKTNFCGSGTITKIGTVVRIITNITLSNSGRTCVFFDFDSNTNSVTKKGICNVRIKGADDFVPMTTQNGKQHAKWLYDNGYIDTEYKSLFNEFGSDIREYSDNGTKYVTTAMANGTNARSCVLLISEDCINWTALGILDTRTADGTRLNVMEAGAFRFGSQFYLIGRNNVNVATDSKDVPYFWKVEDSGLYKSTKPVCLDGDVDCSGAKPSVIRLISRNNLFLLANISAYDKNEFSLVSGISRVAIEFYKLNFDKDTMKAKRILRVSMREGIHTPCLYEYEGNVYMSYTSQKRLLHFMDGDIRFCKIDEELFH